MMAEGKIIDVAVKNLKSTAIEIQGIKIIKKNIQYNKTNNT
jgi:hypothetical protein